MDAQNNSTPMTPRHPEAAGPLQETAEALRALSTSPHEAMRPETKTLQRELLMKHALGATNAAPEQAPTPVQKPSTDASKRRWWVPFSGFAAVAAVILLAVMVAPKLGILPMGGPSQGAIARILIPEAHAGDVFSVFAEHADAAGANTDSAWVVKAGIAVSEAELKETLRIVPEIQVDVQKVDSETFKIIPKEPLEPGKVYKVELAAAIDKGNGQTQTRDFSWAIQTKYVFRTIATIPGDQTGNVPVNTGIEFKFSYPNVEDPKDFFSITPGVAGRFEQRGRTVTFVPEKPLAYGTAYEVRMKQGFGVKESDLGLAADTVVRFETQSKESATQQGASAVVRRFVPREFNVVTPGQDLLLFEQGWYGYGGPGVVAWDQIPVSIAAYRLDANAAKALFADRLTIPEWQPVRASAYEAYATRVGGASPAWTTEVKPSRMDAYGQWYLQVPAQKDPGLFVLKVTPTAGTSTYAFVQVTKNATYTIADTDTLQAWVVDATANKAQEGVAVRAGSLAATTDARGIARLPVAELRSTSTASATGEAPFFLLEVASGNDVYLGAFQKATFRTSEYSAFNSYGPQFDTFQTWSYLMSDRSLYRGTDALELYGFAQDRTSGKGVGALELELVRGGAWKWLGYFGERTTIQTQTVNTDAGGHYTGTFRWNDLAPGYYQVLVRKAGSSSYLTQVGFEVRDFVKPAYTVDIQAEKQRVYGGDEITGRVQARFFDGTPLANTRLTVSGDQYGRMLPSQEIVTDKDGQATYRIKTELPVCGKDVEFCYGEEYVVLTVRPSEGEEGDIVASVGVSVLRSELEIEAMSRSTGTRGEIRLQTRRATLAVDQPSATWPDRTLQVKIKSFRHEQIEDGTYYDFYTKTTSPKYRYERKEGPVIERSVKTDASGSVVIPFTVDRDYWYEAEVTGVDDANRAIRLRPYVWLGWWEWNPLNVAERYWGDDYVDDRWVNLAFTPDEKKYQYAEGERVGFELRRGKKPFPLEKTPGFLMMVASRGLKETALQTNPGFTVSFTSAYIPSMEVRTVTFFEGRFVTAQRSVQLDTTSRELQITATPDRTSYAPGAEAKIKVQVRDPKGNRVPNTNVAVTAVDAAVEALAPSQFVSPLAMYGYVWDGIVHEGWSHDYGDPYGFGGAEKGGGGFGDMALAKASVRRNFKDTAIFTLAKTNQDGEATVAFTLPDNLTTWNTKVAAISDTLLAGATTTEVVVSKATFVDAVIAPRLLTKDTPVLKLRAYGIGLSAGEQVSFVVKAPTLGIKEQRVEGKAFEPMYLAIDRLTPGAHTLELYVGSRGDVDALERKIVVVDSQYEKETEMQVDAFPGVGLPEIGRDTVAVTFTSKAQGSLLPEVRALWGMQWDARVDARIAGRVGAKLLRDLYRYPDVEEATENLRVFQDLQTGGIKLLPYGGPDVELTADVAATAPDLFDRQLLAAYFYGRLEDGSVSREEQIQALAGLAAVGEPVLPSMEDMAALEDLNPREALALGRGFAAAGAKERARQVLDALLAQVGETRGSVKVLKVSDKAADLFEATADAAALAAQTAHPDAEILMAYVQETWTEDAFPLLARARYLRQVAPLRPAGDVSISYTVDGAREETISLREWPVERRFYSKAQAQSFRVTKVTGPVVLSVTKTEPGRPNTTEGLAITRTYDAGKPLSELKEGDAVTVKLRVVYKDAAQDGCYAITDYLPGNFQPLITVNYGWWERSWFPYDVRGAKVSFVGCKDTKNPTEIEYQVRVVGRGTYTAEAPNVQHQSHPSQSAVGQDTVVTVK